MSIERPTVASVAIEVTAACQQRCRYCYNAWRGDSELSDRVVELPTMLRRVQRLLDAWHLGRVTITGGEPFSYPALFDLIGYVREKQVDVGIISNGGLVTNEAAARLAPYAIQHVQITLNGPDAPVHDAHVGAGHFDRALRGIGTLTQCGVRVVGSIVVTRRNASRVGETLHLWRTLGVTQVALSRFSPAGAAVGAVAELLPSRDDLLTAFRQAIPFAKSGMRIASVMPVPPCVIEVEELAPIRFGTCAVGTTLQEFALGADGALRNCTLHATRLADGRDVLDPLCDLAGLMENRSARKPRPQLPAFCEGCIHAPTCGGGCSAAAMWVLGPDTTAPDPIVWQHVDDEFSARLERERRALPILADSNATPSRARSD